LEIIVNLPLPTSPRTVDSLESASTVVSVTTMPSLVTSDVYAPPVGLETGARCLPCAHQTLARTTASVILSTVEFVATALALTSAITVKILLLTSLSTVDLRELA